MQINVSSGKQNMPCNNKVQVLFIHSMFNTIKFYEPIGILYLASVLRQQGYSVTIIDQCTEGDNIEATLKKVMAIRPKMLGVSIMSDIFLNDIEKFCMKVKKNLPEQFIMVGGHGPTILPNKYLGLFNYINVMFIGEAETTLPLFINKHLNNEDWSSLPGLAYRKDKKVVFNPLPEKIIDLDKIPFMGRDVLEEHIKLRGNNIPASLFISRGCLYHCNFCSIHIFEKCHKNKTPTQRYRSVKNVIEEIKYLKDKYGITKYHIEDDNFIIKSKQGRARTHEFCDEVDQLGFKINFYIFARADALEKTIIKRLKEVGLCRILIGLESVSQKSLNFFNKSTSPETNYNAMRILAENGFSADVNAKNYISVGYILWHPLIDYDVIIETLKFFKEFNITYKRLKTKLMCFTGTDLVVWLKKHELLESSKPNATVSDRSWKYVNPTFKIMEKYTFEYFDTVTVKRDNLRAIEVALLNRNKIKRADKITLLRQRLDELCFEYLKRMTLGAKSLSNTELNIFFSENDQYMKNKFEEIIQSEKIDKITNTNFLNLDINHNYLNELQEFEL